MKTFEELNKEAISQTPIFEDNNNKSILDDEIEILEIAKRLAIKHKHLFQRLADA